MVASISGLASAAPKRGVDVVCLSRYVRASGAAMLKLLVLAESLNAVGTLVGVLLTRRLIRVVLSWNEPRSSLERAASVWAAATRAPNVAVLRIGIAIVALEAITVVDTVRSFL